MNTEPVLQALSFTKGCRFSNNSWNYYFHTGISSGFSFQSEPDKTGVTVRIFSGSTGKNGAFQSEPLGNFPIVPEETGVPIAVWQLGFSQLNRKICGQLPEKPAAHPCVNIIISSIIWKTTALVTHLLPRICWHRSYHSVFHIFSGTNYNRIPNSSFNCVQTNIFFRCCCLDCRYCKCTNWHSMK